MTIFSRLIIDCAWKWPVSGLCRTDAKGVL